MLAVAILTDHDVLMCCVCDVAYVEGCANQIQSELGGQDGPAENEPEPADTIEKEWQDLEAESSLPTWGLDYQVRDGEGKILGRIKPMHEGTPKWCLSVYCRLHQCSPPLQRASKAPPSSAILQWFHDAHDLPVGKEGQAAHMKRFHDMTRQ